MHEVWVNAGRLRTRKNTANGIHTFCKTEIMAGPEIDAQFHFADIKTYFNSYTLTGRMNCVLVTYGGIALMPYPWSYSSS